MGLPVFAVSDLHLSHDGRKRMDEFGPVWVDHPQPLERNWRRVVPEDALVLMPGDLSWGTKPPDVLPDYEFINNLPGATFVLSPGNHDYSPWATQNKARTTLAHLPKLVPVKSSAVRIPVPNTDTGVVVAAARGALAPEDKWFARDAAEEPAAMKAFQKELGRLKAALEQAEALRQPEDALVVQIHYPPWANLTEPTAFSAAIERAGADVCVFGHLHNGYEHAGVRQGDHNGVFYRLVGCDALQMTPLRVGEMTADGLQLDPDFMSAPEYFDPEQRMAEKQAARDADAAALARGDVTAAELAESNEAFARAAARGTVNLASAKKLG